MKSRELSKLENYPNLNQCTIAIVGLGYVGLPLAVEFAKKKKSLISDDNLDRKIIGFDINQERLQEIEKGIIKLLVLIKNSDIDFQFNFRNSGFI